MSLIILINIELKITNLEETLMLMNSILVSE